MPLDQALGGEKQVETRFRRDLLAGLSLAAVLQPGEDRPASSRLACISLRVLCARYLVSHPEAQIPVPGSRSAMSSPGRKSCGANDVGLP